MSTELPAESGRTNGESEALARVEPAAAYAVLPAPDAEEPGTDPRRYLAALLRYKWMLVAGAVVGSAGGYVASRLKAPLYQAQATIWVEPDAGPRGPIQETTLLQNTNWLDLLRSYTVLDSVVTEQRLYLEPLNAADSLALGTLSVREQFLPGQYELKVSGGRFTFSRQHAVVQQGAVGDSVGQRLGLVWAPPPGTLPSEGAVGFVLRPRRQIALDVAGRFFASLPDRDGNFIKMTLEGPTAAQTSATLNSIASHFVSVAAILKREKLHQLTGILDTQLASAATELRRAELELERFRVHTITEPSEQQPPVASGLQETQAPALNNYFMMKTEADALRRDREAVDRALAHAADSGVTAVELEGVPSVRANADLLNALGDLATRQGLLRQLRARYTDDNPAVVEAVREIRALERQNIPSMLLVLRNALRTRESTLNDRLQVTARDLRQIPTRSIEEARLTRNVQIAQTLYVGLQQRNSEARLADASSIPDVRILDPAVVPDRPVKNVKLALLGGGLAGGVTLAVALALMLDRFDRRFRYPDQVTRELGLTILGAMPHARNGGSNKKDDAAGQMVEALRAIRLNMLHAYGSAGPMITTITSPGSGDGKSFLASNLAVAFADAGHRTLLIDGDIRRGKLHRVLNLNRKPGLLDYLSADATPEQIVQTTHVPSVDFIGCGTRKLGGPELLSSSAMSRLLISLRSRYNAIIVDCAPLGAGVDPLVLGSITGSMVLVLRTGVTDRELALAKLADVSRLPIRVLGAVLNDVRTEAGYYKYYSYLPGYQAGDEEGEAEGKKAWARRLPASTS